MIRVGYYGYAAWLDVLLAPWTLLWALMATWFCLYGRRQGDPLVQTLLITALGFAFAYVAQMKGWAYHALPTAGAFALALGFALVGGLQQRFMPKMLGYAMLVLAMAMPLIVGPYSNAQRSEADRALATVPSGQPVQILGADPLWAWPLVEERHLPWHSRLYTYWMLPAIAHAESTGTSTPQLRILSGRILEEAALDMHCAPPAAILIERQVRYASQPIPFDMRAFFLRRPDIRAFLADNYQEMPQTPSLYVYRRVRAVTPLALAACPKVY
ncbi:hypothetical protein [Novosphingobium terrae]|uniref:hypothetical protein n=1 Tax=Novosphingobium terrae TaxID=2726189 RepID=UPI00198055FC|nr:hypothetical protein [Novosphingobium terrae]